MQIPGYQTALPQAIFTIIAYTILREPNVVLGKWNCKRLDLKGSAPLRIYMKQVLQALSGVFQSALQTFKCCNLSTQMHYE
jgi:hypothetical protein